MSINSVAISGNLSRDGEMRQTTGGTTVLNFSVAVNNRRQVDGEWRDVPSFIDCVMFGRRAESLYGNGYFAKGRKVSVQGKLSQRSWEAQDGSRRSRVEVVVDEIEFMTQPKQAAQQPAEPDLSDEDLPF